MLTPVALPAETFAVPHGWDNFFVMAGTAAATLMGLLFVAITLGAHLSASRAARGVHVFMTPTLMRFGGVLFQSLALLVPWPSPWPLAIILILAGLTGIIYAIVILRLLRRMDFANIDLRDSIVYGGAPALANASLTAGGIGLVIGHPFAPYAIGGAMALLLGVGIHNAWDMTLWILRNPHPDEPAS